jgi:flotillin
VFIRLTSQINSRVKKDILFGQLRLVIATMTIEEINLTEINSGKYFKNVDSELKKIGLKLMLTLRILKMNRPY